MMETYRMNQKELLAAAKTAYVVVLKSTTTCSRFAVYLEIEGAEKLIPLWPNVVEQESKTLLEYQVRTKKNQADLPVYHFSVTEVGTDRRFLLGKALKKHNPNLKVWGLEGGVPSTF